MNMRRVGQKSIHLFVIAMSVLAIWSSLSSVKAQDTPVDSLWAAAGERYGEGDAEDAVRLLRLAADGQDALAGTEDLTYAHIANDLGYILTDLEAFDEAEEWTLLALDIRTRLSNPDSLDVGYSHETLSRLYVRKKDLSLANASYKKASVQYEHYYSVDTIDYAFFVYTWANELFSAEYYQEAAVAFGVAAASYRAGEGDEGPSYIMCLRNVSYAHSLAGDLEQSVSAYRHVLTVGSSVESMAAEVPTWHYELGGVYLAMGLTEDAVLSFGLFVRDTKDLYGEQTLELANANYNVAKLFEARSDAINSGTYFKESASIFKALLGTHDANYLFAISGLAKSHIDQQMYGEALDVYVELVPLIVDLLDPDSDDYRILATNFQVVAANYLNQLAELDDTALYVQVAQRTQSLSEQLFDVNPDFASYVYHEAAGLAALGDDTTAIQRYKDFIDLELVQHGEPTSDVGYAYRYLASIYAARHDVEGATPMYLKSIEAFRSAEGEDSEEYVTAIAFLSTFLYSEREYEASAPFIRQTVELSQKVLGTSHPDYADYLHNLAALTRQLGDEQAGLDLVRQSIQLEDEYRPDSSENAIEWTEEIGRYMIYLQDRPAAISHLEDVLDRIDRTALLPQRYRPVIEMLADELEASARFDELVEVRRRGLAYAELNSNDSDDAWLDATLWDATSLGMALVNAAEYAEADQVMLGAIAGFTAKYSSNHFYVSAAMLGRGVVLAQAGRYKESELVQAEAVRILDAITVTDEEAETFAISMFGLGFTSLSTGRYNRAIRLLDSAKNLRDQYGIEQSKDDFLKEHQARMIAYTKTARYQELLSSGKQIEAWYESELPPNHPSYIGHLQFMASTYLGIPDQVKSLEYLNRIESILVDEGKQESAEYGTYLIYISAHNALTAYRDDLPLDSSRSSVNRAVSILEKAGETTPLNVAYLLASSIAMLQYDFDGQVEYLERRRSMIARVEGNRSVDYVGSISELLHAYLRNGNIEQALVEAIESLKLAEDVLGKDDVRYAELLSMYGSVLMFSDSMTQAVTILQEADDIYRSQFGEDANVRVEGMTNLANALSVLGDHSGASQKLEISYAISQKNLGEMFGFSSLESMYQQVIAAASIGDVVDLALKDSLYAGQALSWVLQRKGIVTRTIADYRYAQLSVENNPELSQQFENLQDAKQSLVTFQLSNQGIEKAVFDDIVLRRRSHTADLENELKSAMKRPGRSVISTDELHKLLDDRETLIEIVEVKLYSHEVNAKGSHRTPSHYVAFVVSNGTIDVVDLGESSHIDDYAAEYADANNNARRDLMRGEDENYLEEEILEIGNDLFKVIMDPIMPYLSESGKLIVSPDGELNRVPFSALVDHEGRYLIESYDVSYVTSGADMAVAPEADVSGTVVFAGPDFDLGVEGRRASSQKSEGTKNSTARVRGTDKISVRGMKWDALEGAAAEAGDVDQSLGSTEYGPVQIYAAENALEENFKRIVQPRILHVATHGYFLAEIDDDNQGSIDAVGGTEFGAARGLGMLRSNDNPLLRSGVILAGANNIGIEDAQDVDDGWVTAEEISLMDLRGTELVFLSACESGLGDIKSGQSVQGLRQAFQLAGVRSIVSSLYKVPDLETRQIVQSFYGHLNEGSSASDALNKAQREMIKQRREAHGAAHPFFWASFIALGSSE